MEKLIRALTAALLFLVGSGLSAMATAKPKIEGVQKEFLLTKPIECRLVNDSGKAWVYAYTGESQSGGNWGLVGATLESSGKAVLWHPLNPHGTVVLEWPAWRRTQMRMPNVRAYRFLVYYKTPDDGVNSTDGSPEISLRSDEFGVKYPDDRDFPPAFQYLRDSYPKGRAFSFCLVNTSERPIDYRISAEKQSGGHWTKVLYNLSTPYNDQQVTLLFGMQGGGTKAFSWPLDVLHKDGVPDAGKYRIAVEYSPIHGASRTVYSPVFEIK